METTMARSNRSRMARSKRSRAPRGVGGSASPAVAPSTQQSNRHWWQKGEKAVLRAGALSAAIAAIIALGVVIFSREPDAVARAAILNTLLTPQPLSGYTASVTTE